MFAKTKTALFAAAITAFAAGAQAQDAGPYIGAGLGLTDTRNTTVTDTTSRTVKFDNGTMGALALGYAFGNNWRAEAELARRAADLDSVAGTAAAGELLATSLMGNVVYDFDINAPVSPYLGLGLGFARVELDNASPFGTSSINDSDNVLAGQAIAGVSYALQDNLNLFADYRYLTTRDADMTTAAGTAASFDMDVHSVLVGLRFSFGAPAPHPEPMAQPMVEPVAEPMPAAAPAPAPAAPAPELPRNYLVFFDWDKADITEEAAAIIRTAAANANDMGAVRLTLTGHADRSGPEAYNMRLSKRRADAVKAMFAGLGFAEGEIAVFAKGETDPLVPTDDGVREPQNRRVEIVLP